MKNADKPIKPSFEHLTKEINKYFKWENVHKAMLALDWQWALGKDELGNYNMGVPSLETIQNHAYVYLKKAYDEEISQIGSGGFTAGWIDDELYLTFTLEETSVS